MNSRDIAWFYGKTKCVFSDVDKCLWRVYFWRHCDILDREMMRILSRNPASIEILVENELVI